MKTLKAYSGDSQPVKIPIIKFNIWAIFGLARPGNRAFYRWPVLVQCFFV